MAMKRYQMEARIAHYSKPGRDSIPDTLVGWWGKGQIHTEVIASFMPGNDRGLPECVLTTAGAWLATNFPDTVEISSARVPNDQYCLMNKHRYHWRPTSVRDLNAIEGTAAGHHVMMDVGPTVPVELAWGMYSSDVAGRPRHHLGIFGRSPLHALGDQGVQLLAETTYVVPQSEPLVEEDDILQTHCFDETGDGPRLDGEYLHDLFERRSSDTSRITTDLQEVVSMRLRTRRENWGGRIESFELSPLSDRDSVRYIRWNGEDQSFPRYRLHALGAGELKHVADAPGLRVRAMQPEHHNPY